MAEFSTAALYEAGFALPLYMISRKTRTWRWRDEEYTLPVDAVPLTEQYGIYVARIEDVKRAAHG